MILQTTTALKLATKQLSNGIEEIVHFLESLIPFRGCPMLISRAQVLYYSRIPSDISLNASVRQASPLHTKGSGSDIGSHIDTGDQELEFDGLLNMWRWNFTNIATLLVKTLDDCKEHCVLVSRQSVLTF